MVLLNCLYSLHSEPDNPPTPIERFVPATIIDTHYLIISIVH